MTDPSDDQTSADDRQKMQTWIRDSGKLLLEERQRSRDLEAALAESERLERELESRNWLLEQTVETLKQELRELAARYEAGQQQLAAAQGQLEQMQREAAIVRANPAAPDWLYPPSPAAPVGPAPRVRPANQHTPSPGNTAPASPRNRGPQAPPRRRG